MNSNPDKNEFRKYAVKHHRISSTYVDRFIGGVNRSNTPTGIVTPPMGYTPYIIEERQLNISQLDVFSRLMMDRIIFLGDPIYDQNANVIQAQLLFLQSADAKRDIQLYINSPGGSVYAGLGIYDTMQLISNDVATICTGMAASMGAVLLCAGAEGKRAALPHSRVMIHQPSGGAQGQQSDIEISYHEITKLKKELYQIIADHSGASYEKVHSASDRDYWMIAEEAKEFGMIDEILKGNKTKSK
ncbi:ATP-dependent Clp protease proteolytic subunit [Mucilaginibacter phyllosphaerae]|uniref:ATP-dependent Clp protease proteolytic subunit n=1 Tax=Mucilaginibacter phyllosphaerae TaxID=1812349 RepID=A0A4Y8A862_9SPHI|nr:ATP-dependent Clp protease proteolytic subunit [Mucilaginibacter phyllosphaerae]MBB3970585.1 ATP-dependent Clp protease protease subunit [Mucilaginibacter phyllosphaerae]TEW64592.1 ATP-dependent Clp protease proteolytic subunit [Mucilaginibacter phyllosphaerae]GGH19691.1 ATP-dependent Clp protease proteolytic subunit [Mucilaginibacter phyllosphaerae]